MSSASRLVIAAACLIAVAIFFFLEAHAFAPSRSDNILLLKKTALCMTTGSVSSKGKQKNELKIAVVGAGPSGLFLSNLLMKDSAESNTPNPLQISVFDGRSDPRTNELDGRAYALGIGARGRTAIRRMDPGLWEAVKSKGYESERFKVHVGISKNRDLVIPLRSDSTSNNAAGEQIEPSLLIYQSELCATMLENLEELYQHEKRNNKNELQIRFDSKVVDCNLDTMMIRTTTNETVIEDVGPFDLIVGCDGVNSKVRDSIEKNFAEFSTTFERLPGFLKVVRLDYSVGKIDDEATRAPYDPKAVNLLIPSGAFIIPNGDDGRCCILFSARGNNDAVEDKETIKGLPVYLSETQNATAVEEALRDRFPRWKEEAFPDIARQLMAQDLRGNSAAKVTCNTYHYQNKAVILGDAAHSTGGVSGQGLNSALMDVLVLYECLQQQGSGESFDLEASLLKYSIRQVPEGRALYELFFGPNPQGMKKKLLWGLKFISDSIFQGKLGIGEETLQTRLSSELTPFSNIRRGRDFFYEYKDITSGENHGSFPTDDEFKKELTELHKMSYYQ